jgi:geranylgeranyl reductase family protein
MLASDVKYDVIVVGAGPAGSTASYILSEGGLRVLLIDRCFFPRDKLCGGFLTEKSVRLIETIFRESPQSLRQHCAINIESFFYSVWYRSHLLMSGTSAVPFRFVNRTDFDFLLLNHARSSGVCVLEAEAVRECDPSAVTIRTKSGQVYFARFIIGADGVNSIIRQSFPQSYYDHHKWQRNIATGVELCIPLKDFPWDVDRPMIYFGFLNFGYSWVFPRRDSVVVGMGGINRKNQEGIHACFRSFLSTLEIPEHYHENFRSYPIPFGNYLESPGFDSALLVGDAAGFADAIFGEGLYYALKSGELAANAILEGFEKNLHPLKIYISDVKQFLIPHLSHLNKRGLQLYFLLRYFGFMGVWLYVRLKGKKMVNHIHFLCDESQNRSYDRVTQQH